jgi:hypothetical protein
MPGCPGRKADRVAFSAIASVNTAGKPYPAGESRLALDLPPSPTATGLLAHFLIDILYRKHRNKQFSFNRRRRYSLLVPTTLKARRCNSIRYFQRKLVLTAGRGSACCRQISSRHFNRSEPTRFR